MSVSREVKRRRREDLRVETRRAVAVLERRGTCWSDWARERGFSLHAVKDVARDRNPATRGELFEVAARIRADARAAEDPCPDPDQVRAIAARSAEALRICADLLDRTVAITLNPEIVPGDICVPVGEMRAASERARAAQALLGRVSPPEAA